MDLFLQLLANGLVIGTFYALSALGLTLVFGLMRVVNFAHGELYVVGGLLGGPSPILSGSITSRPWPWLLSVSRWVVT